MPIGRMGRTTHVGAARARDRPATLIRACARVQSRDDDDDDAHGRHGGHGAQDQRGQRFGHVRRVGKVGAASECGERVGIIARRSIFTRR